jgi:adenylate kinase family enzyme
MLKPTKQLVIPNTVNSGIIVVYFVGDVLSGKGTQSKRQAELPFSIGEWARGQRQKCPDFARVYGPVMDVGDYLPDPVIFDCFESFVPQIVPGCGRVAIDGLRTGPQAIYAAEHTEHPDFSLCIDLRITAKEAVRRARIRFKQESRSDDFNRKTVLHRYSIWDENREPTLRAFRRQGVRVSDPIDGSLPLREVARVVGGIISKHAEHIRSRATAFPQRRGQRKPPGQNPRHH